VWRSVHAEFLKIWASRIPLIFLLAIPALSYVVVFELYHVEQMGTRLSPGHALEALPILFVAVWKLLIFQVAVLAFSAFWATVDSQYGMIRVVGTQPLSRLEYLWGKWMGVGAHIAILTVGLILSLFGWTALYSGVRGIQAADVTALLGFSLELTVVTLALGGIGLASGTFRRTVGSGIVTAVLVFIGLSVMMTLPFDVFPPRFVLMRYLFFPVQEFPNPFPVEDGLFLRVYSRADFYVTMLATPLVVALPAVLYFRRRDITE
jgi:ABC-type transport system involved in multi-copper enzyme maturation permease subunit